ncbi:MAG: GrpB family protein [Alphaproteobacteria bacterium]|nr:GrpB family protein [Alphaproteobacteria bacterium]
MKITIEKYNKNWPIIFEEEKLRLKNILGSHAINIYHVGSTSVPELAAKPKIDIIVTTDKFEIVRKLLPDKYVYKGEFNIPFRDFYGKYADIKYNIHVFEEGNNEVKSIIMFRDYLRNNKLARKEYELTKLKAAEQEDSSSKNEIGLPKYNTYKNNAIKKILKLAGFNDYIVRYVSQKDESDYFDRLYNLKSSPYKKYILYKGTELVGASAIDNCGEIILIKANSDTDFLYLENFMKRVQESLLAPG